MSAPLFKIDLTPTIGMDFIGLIISAVFYGITSLQTLFYFRTYSKDRPLLKILVGVIWALDTLSLCMTSHGVYTYLVTNYANPLAMLKTVWSISSEPVVTSMIALIVQQFLIYRIYVLNRAWMPFAIVLSVISLAPFSIGIVTVVTTLSDVQVLATVDKIRWMAIAAPSIACALDLTIAGTICFSLYRSRTGFGPTERVVNQLTIYIICSGLLTTTLNLAVLISYLSNSSMLVFQLFNMSVSKAYANTFMATLNTRQSIRGMATDTVAGTSMNNASNMLNFRKSAPLNTGSTVVSRPDARHEYDVPLTKLAQEASYDDPKGMVHIHQHTSQFRSEV